jgi:hypothetical protein
MNAAGEIMPLSCECCDMWTTSDRNAENSVGELFDSGGPVFGVFSVSTFDPSTRASPLGAWWPDAGLLCADDFGSLDGCFGGCWAVVWGCGAGVISDAGTGVG